MTAPDEALRGTHPRTMACERYWIGGTPDGAPCRCPVLPADEVKRLIVAGAPNIDAPSVLALLDELDALRGAVERVREVVDNASPMGPNYQAIRAALDPQ